jgi:hypothetical protein
MENNIVVYRHVRLDTNEVFYIGIGNQRRAFRKDGRSKFWRRIIDKTDYRVDILFDDLTWEEACEKEIEFIQLYGRRNLNTGTLVNLTNGGEGANGAVRTKETKDKMRKPKSDEHKEKISNTKTGKSLSEYHKFRIKEGSTVKKIVLQIDLDDNIVKEWNSLRDVELGGFKHQHVYRVCKGTRKHHKGFKWKYKDGTDSN